VFFGGLTPLTSESGRSGKIGKAVGLLLIVISASLVFSLTTRLVMGPGAVKPQKQVLTESGSSTDWMSSEKEGLARARESNRPVLLDFYAEWCAACRELDEKTWPDADVRKMLRSYIPVKLNLTKEDDVSRGLRQKYHIIGMPTVLVLSPEGRELGRFEGYMPPDKVNRFLQKWVP
jgi:thioredoxin:protein disulfide reductase